MTDIQFKVNEKCRTEGTRVKLKNDHNSYIYMGMASNDDDMSIKRILKVANYDDPTLKIVDNEYFHDNVYLDFSCLENLNDFKKELEQDYGFNNDHEKFFKTFSLFKENYSKIKDRHEKAAFNDIYSQYQKGFKKNIIERIKSEFHENKDEIEFISSLALDVVFEQFIIKIYMDDMDNNEK